MFILFFFSSVTSIWYLSQDKDICHVFNTFTQLLIAFLPIWHEGWLLLYIHVRRGKPYRNINGGWKVTRNTHSQGSTEKPFMFFFVDKYSGRFYNCQTHSHQRIPILLKQPCKNIKARSYIRIAVREFQASILWSLTHSKFPHSHDIMQFPCIYVQRVHTVATSKQLFSPNFTLCLILAFCCNLLFKLRTH